MGRGDDQAAAAQVRRHQAGEQRLALASSAAVGSSSSQTGRLTRSAAPATAAAAGRPTDRRRADRRMGEPDRRRGSPRSSPVSPPRKSRQKSRFSRTVSDGFSASRWPRIVRLLGAACSSASPPSRPIEPPATAPAGPRSAAAATICRPVAAGHRQRLAGADREIERRKDLAPAPHACQSAPREPHVCRSMPQSTGL